MSLLFRYACSSLRIRWHSAVCGFAILGITVNILHNMHSAHAPITEAELRAFVRESLSARTSKPGVYMFEELGIERGAARVDLALVADGLEAFELKSDLDNFGRLHNQIHAYNRVFDRITIVTGETLGGAAMEVLPRWWGIWTVRRLKNGKLALRKLREAAENPRQDIQSLATLLWRDEAAQLLLDETGEDPPKRASRAQLCESIAERVQLSSLRRHVARRLVGRLALGKPTPSRVKVSVASAQYDDLLHLDASCLDFHFPA